VDLALSANPLKLVVQDLLIHHLCREIALQPLEEAEIQAYLDGQSLAAPAPQGLAALLHRHSEGNPLFVVAALEHMIERDLIARENGQWVLRVPVAEIELQVPENLRTMIEIQIERLSREEQRALEVASVDGDVFSTAVSAHAAGMPPEHFEELCEGLARRNLVVRSAGLVEFPDTSISERYRFVHALYREVLYRRQSPGGRADLHLRIGQRLEELYASRLHSVASELAKHFERSGNRSQAARYQMAFECRATV
jgi:predicted ATPase